VTAADLEVAGRLLLDVAAGIGDDDLDRPTPCEGVSVGQLLTHVIGLAQAFRAAAQKDLGPLTDTPPSPGDPVAVDPDWRDALGEHVPRLVRAWRDPEAWEGMTRAGGIDLPGQAAGLVALDEVVLHGWDLARATGQDYPLDDDTAQTCLGFVEQFDPAGTPGLFGPAVPVPADAPVLDRLVGRAGREPAWTGG